MLHLYQKGYSPYFLTKLKYNGISSNNYRMLISLYESYSLNNTLAISCYQQHERSCPQSEMNLAIYSSTHLLTIDKFDSLQCPIQKWIVCQLSFASSSNYKALNMHNKRGKNANIGSSLASSPQPLPFCFMSYGVDKPPMLLTNKTMG